MDPGFLRDALFSKASTGWTLKVISTFGSDARCGTGQAAGASVMVKDSSADLWVFGYGSLMWRPGFPFVERRHAHLYGYHRSLCVLSHVHRGTPEQPGLVLGLDRGGRCHGVAFRVAGHEADATVQYLREREQVTAVYLERWMSVRLDNGEPMRALAYIVDRKHPQYAGQLPFEDVLKLVRQGEGVSGANPDYVRSTHEHLMAMGMIDPMLARIMAALEHFSI